MLIKLRIASLFQVTLEKNYFNLQIGSKFAIFLYYANRFI